MAWIKAIAVVTLVTQINAQITLTGCHLHEGQEVCFLPGGAETTISPTSEASPTSNLITSSATLPGSVVATTTAVAQTTAITSCHLHDTTQYCIKGDGSEVQVMTTATGNEALPTAYSDCHAHGTETFCVAPDGAEVEVVAEGTEEAHSDQESSEGEGEGCHFHAGVEHCPGTETVSCERKDRDYNVNLRIGLLFVILFTSAIGVYAPIILTKLLKFNVSGLVFTVIKQFGTGIIIATALIHLLTHAELMFSNECLGELKYEATATSIAMAGGFLAFLVDYIAHRLAHWRRGMGEAPISEQNSTNEEISKTVEAKAAPPLAAISHHHTHHSLVSTGNDAISVLVLEAGIIFHSLLLGITLVVAGDSVFITLFIVIIFHQMFEGLALGARIAALPSSTNLQKTKLFTLPIAFALVTPVGMAIGIGVLQKFNGNDPSTIVALGTLDALSAGILLWVGFVDMWAGDWLYGELRESSLIKTAVAMTSFIAGMVLMGLLGKWA
ncbi:ZIP zinc transporter-domain-containing protein [Bisporella sp. PMI_857]|nr:ZIP zinc transporter-domain-containing protein [Bisporella sp. PMI_857]